MFFFFFNLWFCFQHRRTETHLRLSAAKILNTFQRQRAVRRRQFLWRQAEIISLLACVNPCFRKGKRIDPFTVVKHTRTQAHTTLYGINSGSLPRFGTIAFISAANRTRVHMNRTPDHLFKRTRVRFAGAHPSSENSVHIIQTNRTMTSFEPGCAPKVLV